MTDEGGTKIVRLTMMINTFDCYELDTYAYACMRFSLLTLCALYG